MEDISMIMVIGSGGGSVAAGSWTFNTVSALPAIVTPSTILAITSTTPGTKYAGKQAPASPVSGDVWFWIDDPTVGILLSDGVAQFKCYGVYQWDGTAWILLTSYVAWMGLWVDLPSLPPVGTSFNDCSWEQIDRIGAAGKEAEYFTVGETKTVALTTSESIQFRIVGMRHDLLADGSGQYAPLSLHMVDCLQATGQMEGSNINTNGWNGCAMRNTCNTTYYGVLPDALKAVVKQVQKKASAGNQSATIVTSFDKVWLAAEIEIFGVITYAKTGEGSQYAYYTNSGVRIKKVAGAASYWWERSPAGGNAANFCYVNSSGAAAYNSASFSYGVALGLCV
jgi:hypothetical protein